MTTVLVATADTIGPRMAGPAIRATHIAEVLSAAGHDVRLVTTGRVEGTGAEAVDGARLLELAGWAEVVVLQGWVLANHPRLADVARILVADVYDPMHLEQLEQGRDAGPEGYVDAVADCTVVLNQQLLRADFLLCASERQRDFWLGQLAGLGRINPATYADDPSLRTLIDVAPFGLPAEPPTDRDDGVGTIPGVGEDDDVVLWGGGIYNWFDPLTLLHAVDQLRHSRPSIRLVFLGTAHPSPDIPTMQMAVDARRLAEDLGLADKWVLFNEGWVPYAERHHHLLRARVGVSTHLHHVETEFSFRTRILDYIWARLPIVMTSGDTLADLVRDEDLGIVVPPGDVEALAAALDTALGDEARRARWAANADRVARRFEWATVLDPLVRFCASPRRAPDLVAPEVRRRLDPGVVPIARSGWRVDLRRAIHLLRSGGPAVLLRRATARIRNRTAKRNP